MKSSPILVAAVTLLTLFLESSTAPVDSSVVVIEHAGVNLNIEGILQKSAIIKDLIVKDAIVKVTDGLENLISNIGDKIKAIAGLGAQDKADDAETQKINKAIDIARGALNRANDVIAAALVKAKGGETIILSGVSVWANSLRAITINIQNQIRAAIASGSVIALEKVSTVTSLSVAVAKTEYAVITNVLSGKTKADFDREMTINFENADTIIAGLNRILSGESSRA